MEARENVRRVCGNLVAEADEGRHTGSDAALREVAERWLMLSAGDLSPTTMRRHRGLLSKHIYPALGDRQAHQIRTSDLDDLYLGLVQSTGLAPAPPTRQRTPLRHE